MERRSTYYTTTLDSTEWYQQISCNYYRFGQNGNLCLGFLKCKLIFEFFCHCYFLCLFHDIIQPFTLIFDPLTNCPTQFTHNTPRSVKWMSRFTGCSQSWLRVRLPCARNKKNEAGFTCCTWSVGWKFVVTDDVAVVVTFFSLSFCVRVFPAPAGFPSHQDTIKAYASSCLNN